MKSEKLIFLKKNNTQRAADGGLEFGLSNDFNFF